MTTMTSKILTFSLVKGSDILDKDTCIAGLEKSAVPLSQTSRFFFWASDFSFSLACWGKDYASHLPTKSLKEQTKTCQGKAKFESFLS